MKIKIFKIRGNSFSFRKKTKTEDVLENQINDWLSANPAIKIREIKQSMCGGSMDPSITMISIWYE